MNYLVPVVFVFVSPVFPCRSLPFVLFRRTQHDKDSQCCTATCTECFFVDGGEHTIIQFQRLHEALSDLRKKNTPARKTTISATMWPRNVHLLPDSPPALMSRTVVPST